MKWINKNKELLCKSSLLIGMLLYVVYAIVNRFVTVPDMIATPICIVSIILMLVGITWQGYRAGKWNQNKDKELREKNESKRTNHKL